MRLLDRRKERCALVKFLIGNFTNVLGFVLIPKVSKNTNAGGAGQRRKS